MLLCCVHIPNSLACGVTSAKHYQYRLFAQNQIYIDSVSAEDIEYIFLVKPRDTQLQ